MARILPAFRISIFFIFSSWWVLPVYAQPAEEVLYYDLVIDYELRPDAELVRQTLDIIDRMAPPGVSLADVSRSRALDSVRPAFILLITTTQALAQRVPQFKMQTEGSASESATMLVRITQDENAASDTGEYTVLTALLLDKILYNEEADGRLSPRADGHQNLMVVLAGQIFGKVRHYLRIKDKLSRANVTQSEADLKASDLTGHISEAKESIDFIDRILKPEINWEPKFVESFNVLRSRHENNFNTFLAQAESLAGQMNKTQCEEILREHPGRKILH